MLQQVYPIEEGQEYVIPQDIKALEDGKKVRLDIFVIDCSAGKPKRLNKSIEFIPEFELDSVIFGAFLPRRKGVLCRIGASNQFVPLAVSDPIEKIVVQSESRHNEEYPEPVIGPLQAPSSVRV